MVVLLLFWPCQTHSANLHRLAAKARPRASRAGCAGMAQPLQTSRGSLLRSKLCDFVMQRRPSKPPQARTASCQAAQTSSASPCSSQTPSTTCSALKCSAHSDVSRMQLEGLTAAHVRTEQYLPIACLNELQQLASGSTSTGSPRNPAQGRSQGVGVSVSTAAEDSSTTKFLATRIESKRERERERERERATKTRDLHILSTSTSSSTYAQILRMNSTNAWGSEG